MKHDTDKIPDLIWIDYKKGFVKIHLILGYYPYNSSLTKDLKYLANLCLL